MLAALTRSWKGDIVFAVAVGALMQFEIVHEHLTPYAASVPVFLITAAAVPLRRRAPLLVLAIGMAGGLVTTVAGVSLHEPFSPMIVMFVVLYSVGLYEPPRRGAAALAASVLVSYAQIAIAMHNGEPYDVTDFGFIAVLIAAPVLVGTAIRTRTHEAREATRRADRLESERLAAVAEERARIARELHDVIAHSVSVMVVQAGAAEAVLERDPARAVGPVRAVQETGRQALVEMSRLVGLLREDGEELGLAPQPGLDALDALLGQVRESGLPVELRVEGEPQPLPLGVELSAYRIVQEALTNSLKHAGRARAVVLLRYSVDAVEVEVVDDGGGNGTGHVGGHGLAGMRERVAVFGGEFAAGRRDGGGYAVRARLPIGAT
ncbi:MAG TPA: histidine kinase [Gaiellaceae bacterium]|nr:histidine kinase [Gaiellaceae bacterium]